MIKFRQKASVKYMFNIFVTIESTANTLRSIDESNNKSGTPCRKLYSRRVQEFILSYYSQSV